MPVKRQDVSMMIATDAPAGLGPLTATRNEARDDENALIEAVRRGVPGSREAIYHRYKRRVFALSTRIVGAGDAEEVAQEAFIRIFRGLDRFRGDSALGTWIYRLAVNAALSHRSRRPPPTDSLDDREHHTILDTSGADLGPVHGDAALRKRLERGLAALPVGYRTVVVLHDVEGLEHEEIAQVLGCHVGTSKSQLHKARARLREILAADGITVRDLGIRTSEAAR